MPTWEELISAIRSVCEPSSVMDDCDPHPLSCNFCGRQSGDVVYDEATFHRHAADCPYLTLKKFLDGAEEREPLVKFDRVPMEFALQAAHDINKARFDQPPAAERIT